MSHEAWLAHYGANPHLSNTALALAASLLFSALCVQLDSTLWAILCERIIYFALGLALHRLRPRRPGWLTAALDYLYEPDQRPDAARVMPMWFLTGPHMLPYFMVGYDVWVLLGTTALILLCVVALYQAPIQ